MRYKIPFFILVAILLVATGWVGRDFYHEKVIVYNPADIYEFEALIEKLIVQMTLYNSFAIQAFPIVWNESKPRARKKLKDFAYVIMDSSVVETLNTLKKMKVR